MPTFNAQYPSNVYDKPLLTITDGEEIINELSFGTIPFGFEGTEMGRVGGLF